jgi:hypothetical protein
MLQRRPFKAVEKRLAGRRRLLTTGETSERMARVRRKGNRAREPVGTYCLRLQPEQFSAPCKGTVFQWVHESTEEPAGR